MNKLRRGLDCLDRRWIRNRRHGLVG